MIFVMCVGCAEFWAESDAIQKKFKNSTWWRWGAKNWPWWAHFRPLIGRFLKVWSIKIGQSIHHSNKHRILFKMRYRLTWFSDHPLKNDQNSNFQNSKTCLSLRGHISALESKSKKVVNLCTRLRAKYWPIRSRFILSVFYSEFYFPKEFFENSCFDSKRVGVI